MVFDKKEYAKIYYLKNKEKIKEKNKQYRENNKESISQQKKEYNKSNKEKTKEYNKQYREKNPEYIKEYNKTDKCIKSNRISQWKTKYKIIEDNWNLLYEIYINTNRCDICNVKLIDGSKCNRGKCLDHDHESGYFRGVLCYECNKRDDKGL